MKDLDATRGVFKKLLQSQELKKSQKQREIKEAKEAEKARKTRETERVRSMNQKKAKTGFKKDVFYYKIPEISNMEDLQKFSLKMKKTRDSPISRKSGMDASLNRTSSKNLIGQVATPKRSAQNSGIIWNNISTIIGGRAERSEEKFGEKNERLKIPLYNKENTLTQSFGVTTQDQENTSPRLFSPNFENLLTSRYCKDTAKHEERLTSTQKALIDQVKLGRGANLIRVQKEKRKQHQIEQEQKREEKGLRVQKNLQQLNETYRKSHESFQQSKVLRRSQIKEKKTKKLLSKSVKSPANKKQNGYLRRSPSLPITISPVVHLGEQESMTPIHRSQGNSPSSSLTHITPAPFSCSLGTGQAKTPLLQTSYLQRAGFTPLKSLELYSKLLPQKVEEEESRVETRRTWERGTINYTLRFQWNQGFCRLSLCLTKQDSRKSFIRLKENALFAKNILKTQNLVQDRATGYERVRKIEVSSLRSPAPYSPLRPLNYCRFDEKKNFRFMERKNDISSQNSSGQWGKAASRILKELKQGRQEKQNQISTYSGSFSQRVGLRLAFGSEQAVRENSGFVLQNCSRGDESCKHLENSVESVFQHTAFQDFQHKQILKLLQPSQMEEFLSGIEKKLERTIEKKTENIENLFGKVRVKQTQNLISPRGRDVRIEEVKARLRSNKKEIEKFRKNLIGINKLIDQVREKVKLQIQRDKESVKSLIGEGNATPRPLDSSRTLFLPHELQKFESRNDSLSLRQSEEVKDDGTTPIDSLEFFENEKKVSTVSCSPRKEQTLASEANQVELVSLSKNLETNESSPELESGLNLNNEAFLNMQELQQSERPKIESDFDILGKDESFLRAVEECKQVTNSELFDGDLPSITPPDTPCQSVEEAQSARNATKSGPDRESSQVIKVNSSHSEDDIILLKIAKEETEEIGAENPPEADCASKIQAHDEPEQGGEQSKLESKVDEQKDVEIVYEREKEPDKVGSGPVSSEKEYSSLENFQTEIMEVPKKVGGINTRVQRVLKYVDSVYLEIQNEQDGWKRNLSTPLLRNPLEVLFHLQNSEGQFEQGQEGQNFLTQQSVLGIQIYLEIERKRKLAQEIDWEHQEIKGGEQRSSEELEEGRERENIHNKAIFDALNQAFDSHRPFGLKGPPLPWTNNKRTLSFKQKEGGKGIQSLLTTVKGKVVEWANTRAGAVRILPEDQEGEDEDEQPNKGSQSEKEKLEAIREEKLAILLAEEVEEGEQLWVDYEYQETQTKLDLADMVLDAITRETIDKLREIEEKRAL